MNSSTSPKEENELLYNTLKANYQGIVDFEFRQSALIVLLLGWSLTSTRTQALFASSTELRVVLSCFVFLLTCFHALWVIHYYYSSNKAYKLLKQLMYMPEDYFALQKIPKWVAITFCLIHASISTAIIIVIWLMPSLSNV